MAYNKDLESIYEQAIRLVKNEYVISTDRSKINIKADTLYIHGDNVIIYFLGGFCVRNN